MVDAITVHVASPPAPPEYCLFWADRWWPFGDPWLMCMQKGEWSGWAQAVGAILGLAIAIGIPWKARLDARRDALSHTLALTGQVQRIFERQVDACDRQDFETFATQRTVLMSSVDLLNGIPFASLTANRQSLTTAFRAAVLAITHRSMEHTAQGNWEHWREEMRKGAEGARAMRARIREDRLTGN